MAGTDDGQQHWRQFQGTELGGLLSSIYGGQRRKINYPLPKRASFDPSASKFRPVNSTLQTTDPTKSTRKNVAVAVPKKFGRSESKENIFIAPLPSRKSEEAIRAELEEINMRQKNYRPAYVRPQGDHEKERYAQICMYKGGKGLPIVMPVGETPFEAAARLQMQQKNDEFTRQRRLARGDERATAGALAVLKSPRMTAEEKMSKQISNEIDERCEYLEEMKGMGALTAKDEARLISEINSRMAELKRLNVE